VIILPSSFDTGRSEVREFLSEIPPHVTVYCREKISHALAREAMAHPDNLELDQDLAFHCDYRPWAAHHGKGTLVSFRTDAETAREAPPVTSIDVSRFGDKHDSWPLLFTVSRFAEVHTDRMHVGIVAAMTGRKTFLFDNSYHKIRAVYEHSLAQMENVRYMGHGSTTASPSAGSRFRMKLIHVLMRIRKPLVRAAFHIPRRRLRSASPPVVGSTGW
jgi:exopolysaccharide biosynthesis predicted pyruvyltransferase EpsI